ncbi:MAG: polysaccharide biosynthesis tyrosine autokinase, partial [Thioalkalivibrio sp.]|nr:polysaccharide biosynthesis tyrosine autokinase [Thioalkalivibrio sp.]
VLMARPTVDQQSFGTTLVTAPPLDPSAYRAAALSSAQLRTVLQATGTSTPTTANIAKLRGATEIRVENDRNSALFYFSVVADDPDEAAALANAAASALVAWDVQRATSNLQQIIASLESQIASLSDQIAELRRSDVAPQDQLDGRIQLRADRQEQLSYARTLVNSAVGLLDILEPAEPRLAPIAPRPVRSAMLAFVLGLFVVYGLMLLRDALDTRLRDSDDLSRATGLPVLAEFPKIARSSRGLPTEASNYLRTNVMFATADDHPKVLLVTSSMQTEGKTSVASGLAESFARNGHRTLLVDADLRKPMIGQKYGLDAGTSTSLRHWLRDPADAPQPTIIALGSAVSLDIVPSFDADPSPTELLNRGFAAALEHWRTEYDVIVIDSAPVLPVADTLTIASLCSGTLLVASADQTDRRRLAATVSLLRRIGVRLIGVVATNLASGADTADGYGYGYGVGYGRQVPAQRTANASGRAKRKPGPRPIGRP